MANFTQIRLSAALDDWTGASIFIRSEDCPGGVAVIIGGAEQYADQIAATLEMYWALKEAVALYARYGLLAQEDACGPWINKARAALAKADGKVAA